MVGSASDNKLSAFSNMCFSKSPHFGNRGATPVGVGERASIYADFKFNPKGLEVGISC